jgi:hypothetical protein
MQKSRSLHCAVAGASASVGMTALWERLRRGGEAPLFHVTPCTPPPRRSVERAPFSVEPMERLSGIHLAAARFASRDSRGGCRHIYRIVPVFRSCERGRHILFCGAPYGLVNRECETSRGSPAGRGICHDDFGSARRRDARGRHVHSELSWTNVGSGEHGVVPGDL